MEFLATLGHDVAVLVKPTRKVHGHRFHEPAQRPDPMPASSPR
jgi:hypothetical protein